MQIRLVITFFILFLSADAFAQDSGSGGVNYGVSVFGAVTPNDCVKFNSAWVIQDSGSTCGGGGSVSVTAGSSNIVINPSPGTGTFTVDTGASPAFATSVRTPLVIGGTGAASTLTLESTSGAGTTDSIIFNTGSQTTQLTIGTTKITAALPMVGNSFQPTSTTSPANVGIFTNGLSYLQFAAGGATPAAFLTSSSFVMGGSNPFSSAGAISPAIQTSGAGNVTASAIGIGAFSNNASGGNFFFDKSRNGVVTLQTVVQSGDSLGAVNFEGSDGTNFKSSAIVTGAVDAVPSTGIVPGRITFSTANASGTMTEAMRINSSQQVGIGTTSPSTGVALDLGSNTNSMLLPVGTTGQRPATGINGMVRYNSTLNLIEGYINSTWSFLLSGSSGTPTCGTGCASITAGSTNVRGSMVSSSSVSSVALNFSGTLGYTPVCTISDSNTSAVADISSISTSALTVSMASALSAVTIYYICVQ